MPSLPTLRGASWGRGRGARPDFRRRPMPTGSRPRPAGPGRAPRGAGGDRASRSSCRSAMAGWRSRRSRSIAARPCRWRPTCRRRRRPGIQVQLARRRASLELRAVRVARARPAVRHQRLRRDASGTLGVGRQAARRRASCVAARERGFDAHQARHAVHEAVRSVSGADGRLRGDAGDRRLLRAGRRRGNRRLRRASARDRTSQTTVKSAAHHDALHELPKLTAVDATGRAGSSTSRRPSPTRPT